MRTNPVLQGNLVQLKALNAEEDAPLFTEWSLDTEYWRLLAADPALPWRVQRVKEDINKGEVRPDTFEFSIHTLTDDLVIGYADLESDNLCNGDCFLGIGIGLRNYWGKGFGTDTMRILMRYAFDVLNFHRVSLNVFEYNDRAIACYQKVGFIEEGRQREFLHRSNQRWDLIYMGILRSEWEQTQSEK